MKIALKSIRPYFLATFSIVIVLCLTSQRLVQNSDLSPSFVRNSLFLGTIRSSGEIRYIEVDNPLSSPLSIRSCETSCSCVKVMQFPNVVSAQSRGKLKVQINSVESQGASIRVALSSKNHKSLELIGRVSWNLSDQEANSLIRQDFSKGISFDNQSAEETKVLDIPERWSKAKFELNITHSTFNWTRLNARRINSCETKKSRMRNNRSCGLGISASNLLGAPEEIGSLTISLRSGNTTESHIINVAVYNTSGILPSASCITLTSPDYDAELAVRSESGQLLRLVSSPEWSQVELIKEEKDIWRLAVCLTKPRVAKSLESAIVLSTLGGKKISIPIEVLAKTQE